MPTSPKLLLILIALLEGIVGLLLIVAPAEVIAGSIPGIAAGVDGVAMARTAGTALVSLGVLAWLARNTSEPAALRPVLGALIAYNVLATLNLLYQASTIAPGSLVPALIHLALSVALVFYWRKTA